MELTLEQVVEATGGTVLNGRNMRFTSYNIDSRKMEANGLFFALKGETTDGHLFVADAFRHGAGGAVVERETEDSGTMILVSDSWKALHDAARYARNNSSAKYIGITGSSGKTSTKEFVAFLLSQQNSVYKSEGNLNSLTGLPLSLLSIEKADIAVFEVAMNRPGEIETLSSLLKPDIGVLLNVNAVHLGQFSSIEEIADEKCSLVKGMAKDGILIFNADDQLIVKRISAHSNAISYGFSDRAALQITEVSMDGVSGSTGALNWKGKKYSFKTKLCGKGNLYNIAAATTVALTSGITMDQIISSIALLEPYRQRGILTQTNAIFIYDDSYNSNPKALELAFEMMAQSKQFTRKIAVVGDMLELGPQEEQFHRDAGRQAAAAGIDVLIATGHLSKAMADEAKERGLAQVHWAQDSNEAARIATEIRKKGDLFLVKGSRGMKMEIVIEHLKA